MPFKSPGGVHLIITAIYTGRPCGDEDFIKTIEAATGRVLAPSKRGPKANVADDNPVMLPWTEDEIRF